MWYLIFFSSLLIIYFSLLKLIQKNKKDIMKFLQEATEKFVEENAIMLQKSKEYYDKLIEFPINKVIEKEENSLININDKQFLTKEIICQDYNKNNIYVNDTVFCATYAADGNWENAAVITANNIPNSLETTLLSVSDYIVKIEPYEVLFNQEARK